MRHNYMNYYLTLASLNNNIHANENLKQKSLDSEKLYLSQKSNWEKLYIFWKLKHIITTTTIKIQMCTSTYFTMLIFLLKVKKVHLCFQVTCRPVRVLEVVYDSGGAGQRIKDFPLWLGAHSLQHVDEMVVKAGKRCSLLQWDIHPVPYTLQRRFLIAGEHSGVSEQPPGSHHS